LKPVPVFLCWSRLVVFEREFSESFLGGRHPQPSQARLTQALVVVDLLCNVAELSRVTVFFSCCVRRRLPTRSGGWLVPAVQEQTILGLRACLRCLRHRSGHLHLCSCPACPLRTLSLLLRTRSSRGVQLRERFVTRVRVVFGFLFFLSLFLAFGLGGPLILDFPVSGLHPPAVLSTSGPFSGCLVLFAY